MKKLIKISQHAFVKGAQGDLTIQFMRDHPGFISYVNLVTYSNYVTKKQTYRGVLRELEDISRYCDKMELILS